MGGGKGEGEQVGRAGGAPLSSLVSQGYHLGKAEQIVDVRVVW